MNSSQPTCYIIAGPNGSGKTTYALSYLPTVAACRNFINADEIARGLSPLDYKAALLQASRIFLSQIEQKINNKENFAIETTLAGKHYLPKIKQWQTQGWRIVLIFLYIPGPEFSAERVRQRVRQGGHDISEPDIIRRYPRCIKNLFAYMEICDETLCLDNSGPVTWPVFSKEQGHSIEIYDSAIFHHLQEILVNE